MGTALNSDRAQLELMQSEERFSKTFMALPAPIVISRLVDGVIVEVNTAWERENGISRADAVGRPGAVVGHWTDLEARERIVQQVRAEGRADNHLVRFVRRNGEAREVLVSCTRIDLGGEPHLLWNSRDITELRAAEAAVRKSGQRFRALVELSSDWYWETDAQHRFTYRQGAVLERMGLPVARDIGKARWEIRFSNMKEADWAAHRAVLERREEFRDLLLERPSEDGRVHWATVSGRPLYDENGNFAGYHGIGRDVTAQKNAEWALRESQAAISEAYEELKEREAALRRLAGELESKVLERTSELAAANKDLESFSYSVSHDLRAPLGAISGFAHLLRGNEGARLSVDGVHLLTMLERNAERSVELIEGLLRFARLGRAPVLKTSVSVDDLVREAAEELRRPAGAARAELRIGRLPDCEGERMLLRQVWINLLGNALKYSRGRNPPVVEVGFDEGTGEYWVRDNGAGFDPRHAQKLFGVFERLHTEDEFEGTGVGLAIVKRIIERHGGSIRAEGAPGQGATFRFSLPV